MLLKEAKTASARRSIGRFIKACNAFADKSFPQTQSVGTASSICNWQLNVFFSHPPSRPHSPCLTTEHQSAHLLGNAYGSPPLLLPFLTLGSSGFVSDILTVCRSADGPSLVVLSIAISSVRRSVAQNNRILIQPALTAHGLATRRLLRPQGRVDVATWQR